MTLHSMTGYADATQECAGVVLHADLRSVNGRFLDVILKLPDELRAFEPMLREAITARLARGKVECRISLQTRASAMGKVADTALIAQLAQLQTAVRALLPDAAPFSVHDILRWPGVLAEEPPLATETLQAALSALISRALDGLIAARAREGARLSAVLATCAQDMRLRAQQAASLLPQVLIAYEQRIASKLHEAAVQPLEPERIQQEISLLAVRLDVQEELTRLQAHIDEMERILRQAGPAGKRLDFLAQELNREANTLASKSVSTEITALALELKLLIEQVREQVQNLE